MRNLVPVLGWVGLAILCFFCLRCHAPGIEAGLAEAGRQQLADGGFDAVTLRVDGRDATLEGVAGSDARRDEAAQLVAAVAGMRTVDNQLRLPVPARFELARSGDGITLRGRLPSDAHRDAIVRRVGELWVDQSVADELEVDAATEEPEWLGGLPAALGSFSRRTRDGAFAIEDDRLTIGGRTFAESAREALLERLGQHLPGLEITDESEVLPPETVEELQSTLDTAVLSRTVEFASGSAELTDLGRSVLDEIFELLSSQEAVRIAIAGHTDDQGRDDFNLDLSRRRAKAAGDYLVARGLAADRFEAAGFGETRPIADNATPEGRLRNRRIEFDVLEKAP